MKGTKAALYGVGATLVVIGVAMLSFGFTAGFMPFVAGLACIIMWGELDNG